MFRSLLITLSLFAGPAFADVTVTFQDGAPKDRFSITNDGTCALPPISVLIDLSSSPAGLIFDVTAQGGGVEVFQPLEITAGSEFIDAVSTVGDGDQTVQFDLRAFPVGSTVRFTADLDDTIGATEITVSGSEIAGARVFLGTEFDVIDSAFDDAGRAVIPLAPCVS